MKRFASPFDTIPARAEPGRITSLDAVHPGLSGIYSMGPSIIDLIPKDERAHHTYMRGASLGATAYNLLRYGRLNTTTKNPENATTHFAMGPQAHTYADQIARSIAHDEGYAGIQFPPDMRAQLARDAGATPSEATPGIVFALHPDYNDYLLPDSERGACEGVVWGGEITLDMIDERSRAALEKILETAS